MHLPYMLWKENGSEVKLLNVSKKYQEKVMNAVRLVQYTVTTVKTVAAHWLFILQLIKAIQLVKHPVHAVLLGGTWLRCVFFCMTWRSGTFSLFWRCVWMLIFFFFFFFFFFYMAKFHFLCIWPNFFQKKNRTFNLCTEIYSKCERFRQRLYYFKMYKTS